MDKRCTASQFCFTCLDVEQEWRHYKDFILTTIIAARGLLLVKESSLYAFFSKILGHVKNDFLFKKLFKEKTEI